MLTKADFFLKNKRYPGNSKLKVPRHHSSFRSFQMLLAANKSLHVVHGVTFTVSNFKAKMPLKPATTLTDERYGECQRSDDILLAIYF